MLDHELHADQHGAQLMAYWQKYKHRPVVEIEQEYAQNDFRREYAIDTKQNEAVPRAYDPHQEEQN